MSIADVLKDRLKHWYVPSVGSLRVEGMNIGIENLNKLNIQVLDDSVCTVIRYRRSHHPLGTGGMFQCGTEP